MSRAKSVVTNHDGRAGVECAEPRATVKSLFEEHSGKFAKIPGQVSEFRLNSIGHEWRCEYNLGNNSPGSGFSTNSGDTVLLIFSLIDLQNQASPTAALYLQTRCPKTAGTQNTSLSLEDLVETQETLNQHPSFQNASLEMLGNADRFIAALSLLNESLGDKTVWN